MAQSKIAAGLFAVPTNKGIFYAGGWHASRREVPTFNPGTGEELARVGHADAEETEKAIAAAKQAFQQWRKVPPLERAKIMRQAAAVIRDHANELALLDAANCGNPVAEMASDVAMAAAQFDFFAGLVTEMKGASIPMGPKHVNFSVREPMGVVARILAFNHPILFSAGKLAAPLAAGNTVIVKPPEQAPLSGLRLAELIGHLFPPGVVNIVTGGRECGEMLASHKDVAMVTLVGSPPTGRAVMRSASDTLKPLLFELGGKNALIAFADADPEKVASAAVSGMNYTWCGQSCGSVSRVFLHDSIHDAVVERMGRYLAKYKPGLATDPATTMGSIISKPQYDRIRGFIESGKKEGGHIAYGGKTPDDPQLSGGYFIEPTVFVGITQDMRIAREEIFGPVQSVIRWQDETQMLADVNSVEYGLTCAIYTKDIDRAHRTASEVEAGYIWINNTSSHFQGAPFGGYKQSGIGREECLGELISFTQEKNINILIDGA